MTFQKFVIAKGDDLARRTFDEATFFSSTRRKITMSEGEMKKDFHHDYFISRNPEVLTAAYSTSEATENDVVCGIEVLPGCHNKETSVLAEPNLSMATLSTATISSDESNSGSWSDSPSSARRP